MKRLMTAIAAALMAMAGGGGPVAAQVTGTLTGPAVLPEGGLIAVKYGQCLQPGDRPLFTPGNRYCEWQGGHSGGAMPFARTGRFTVTLTNEGNSDVNTVPNIGFFRLKPRQQSINVVRPSQAQAPLHGGAPTWKR